MAGTKKRGQQTVVFDNPPVITSWAAIVGPKEGEGPWRTNFDQILDDYMYGETTWEKAEHKMLRDTVKLAAAKRNLQAEDAELLLAGDLLNQTVSSNFAARELNIPFLGLYGACSTMAESLLVGAMLVDGNFFSRVIAATGSHHYAASRQYRFPTERGVQPASHVHTWTATARRCHPAGLRRAGPQSNQCYGWQGSRFGAVGC